MKNDLDFIKEKIDTSGVNAPDDMNESYVMSLLGSVEPKSETAAESMPTAKPKQKILRFAIPAVAAALVISITLGIVLHFRTNDLPVKEAQTEPQKEIELTPSHALSLRQFENYDEIKTEVERLGTVNYRKYDDVIVEEDAYSYSSGESSQSGSSGAASNGNSGGSFDSAGSAGHNATYIQVTGVDEADIILTDDKYLYCVDQSYGGSFSKIVIFSAEGKNSHQVARIDPYAESNTASSNDSEKINMHTADYCGISDIYLKDNRLIAICDYIDTESSAGVINMIRVNVYDVSDIDHITLLDSFSQSGAYDSSRMIDDTLYLVSTFHPDEEEIIPCCGNDAEKLPADRIYCLDDASDNSFLVVSTYHTLDHSKQTESKAILGGVDDIYCNRNHLYVYSTIWEDNTISEYVRYSEDSIAIAETEQSQILKVDLTNGLSFDAYTSVNGTIDDQYALDEKDGYLRVATTSTSKNWTTENNLFVLDDKMNEVGSVTGFAENESIKAVRYIEDTAYVITYEQTDPLFVIDLSKPEAPAILGEVKITGFSTMLVPVDDHTLLGIGNETSTSDESSMEIQSGLKLALFDISDKSHPKVLDSLSYTDCSSEVQMNPKALVINRQRNDYVIPLNYYHWEEHRSSSGDYDYKETYTGGMLNFKIENGKIIEEQHYESDAEQIERCAYVGDTIYMTYHEVVKDTTDEYSMGESELKIDSVSYQ